MMPNSRFDLAEIARSRLGEKGIPVSLDDL